MHWNYRVLRHIDKKTGEAHLAIHEYYYDMKGTSDCAWSETPDAVIGETVEDLRTTLKWMLKALDKPVLDFEPEQSTNKPSLRADKVSGGRDPSPDGYPPEGVFGRE